MRIGEIERIGEREIPMPALKPQKAPAEPTPPSPAQAPERQPSNPEKVQ
jgi:hypothetical protein